MKLTEDGRPIGHDGKPCSEQAWRRFHAVVARIEERYNAELIKAKGA